MNLSRIYYPLPDELLQEVGRLFIQLKHLGFVNGRSSQRVLYSLVYYVGKVSNSPVDLSDLEIYIGYSRKEILRTYKKIKRVLSMLSNAS